jgi:hypothetical protein
MPCTDLRSLDFVFWPASLRNGSKVLGRLTSKVILEFGPTFNSIFTRGGHRAPAPLAPAPEHGIFAHGHRGECRAVLARAMQIISTVLALLLLY